MCICIEPTNLFRAKDFEPQQPLDWQRNFSIFVVLMRPAFDRFPPAFVSK